MPNWCYTSITIDGDSNSVKYLESELEKATSRNYVENGFGTSWLGNVVEYLGCSYNDIPCRGRIEDIICSDGHMQLFLETAWSPQMKPILMLIEHLGLREKLKFTYEASEDGMGLYLTNDEELVDKYLVENCTYGDVKIKGPINDWEYDTVDEATLRDAICQALEIEIDNEKSIWELIDDLQDEYINVVIHQYEYADEYDV